MTNHDDVWRPWTADDVPPGPYFHGTRFEVRPGDPFDLSVPSSVLDDVEWGLVGDPDQGGDDRRMFWATTSPEEAMGWAFQSNGIRLRGLGLDRLYVWEVELDDPEVDANYHTNRVGRLPLTSVRASSGRFVRLHDQLAADEFPGSLPF
jgi:hypothetical protein